MYIMSNTITWTKRENITNATQTSTTQHIVEDIKKYEMNEASVQIQTYQSSIRNECEPNIPCMYKTEVDIRIIVIVFNRVDSLKKCLNSLQTLVLGNSDTGSIDIWIDRSKITI